MRTVLAIGNHVPPHSTENSYAYAFEQHGWHVEKIEQTDAHRYGPDHVLEAASVVKPELVTYTRTHNHTALGKQWTDVWRALEQRGIQTASIHLDVFWGIEERERWIADGDPLFSTGTVFTADGRHSSEQSFFVAGVNHQWLPPAIDERNLLPADTRFEPCDGLPPIVWVGTSAYHYEWPWRAELVNFLRKEYPTRLIEYGHGSPNGSCRDNATLTTLYAADTIVVGDSMFAGRDGSSYWSDRVSEVMGRGGFLVHPMLPSVGPYSFDPGHHYEVLFDLDTHTLRQTIEWCGVESETPGWRLRTKTSALRRARDRDTYTHRAGAILRHLGLDDMALRA